MANKHKPNYTVHYDRATKTRWVELAGSKRRYYITKIQVAGTKKPHYVLLPKSDFPNSPLYSTVRDAVFALVFTRLGRV